MWSLVLLISLLILPVQTLKEHAFGSNEGHSIIGSSSRIITQSDSNDYYTYINTTLGIKFSYPLKYCSFSTYYDVNGSNIRFFCIGDNIIRLIINQEKNLTFSDFTNKRIKEIENNSTKLNGFKVVDSQPAYIAGNPAHRITYNLSCQFCFPSSTTEIWTVKGNTSYLFRYYTEIGNPYPSRQLLHTIIDSFEIIGSPSLKDKLQSPHLKPWSGITYVNSTELIAKALNLKGIRGLLVTDVLSGSPAGKAGIRGGYIPFHISSEGRTVKLGGDLIIGLDGRSVVKLNNLIPKEDKATVVRKSSTEDPLSIGKRIGDLVTLTLLRDGVHVQNVELMLAPRPSYLLYENAVQGVKLLYPSDWEIGQESQGLISINNRFHYDEGITVQYSSSSGKSLKELTNDKIINLKNRNLTDLTFIESSITSIANNTAYIIKYAYTCPPENCMCIDINPCPKTTLKKTEIWTVKQGTEYHVTINQGQIGDNLFYYLEIQNMMESFELIPKFVSGIYLGLSV